ncbi:hypothetical protein RRG08_004998 [Elysia crispata]|uniref:Uncharacterized protein n=1 Tax=Elysia crispata TaxID=231223 RepID=A0AAE1AVC6_9GAST|nr:hypothetical protein RRG08_004998 [Elysia crispata]
MAMYYQGKPCMANFPQLQNSCRILRKDACSLETVGCHGLICSSSPYRLHYFQGQQHHCLSYVTPGGCCPGWLYATKEGLIKRLNQRRSEGPQGACMNGSGESRKEATGKTKEVLNAKTKTRIGFWNVRTMFETGKLAQVKTTYQEADRTILGHRNERHKDWTRQEAWRKVEERKDIKKKVLSTKSERIKTQQQQAYREADRAVKQIIRHDKRKHLEDMATQAEEAAYKGDQRTLYKTHKTGVWEIQKYHNSSNQSQRKANY